MIARRLITLVTLAVLAACSGGGTFSSKNALPSTGQEAERPVASLTAASTPAPTPTPLKLYAGRTNGVPGFSPTMGDTSSGGHGQVVDDIPCGAMDDNGYHVHAFLGVMVNGKQIAIPPTIGMLQPGPVNQGSYLTAKCFYQIHTHDASGYIHLESTKTKTQAPLSSWVFTLGNVIDVWGQPLTTTGFGNFSGPVHIFYATTNLGNVDGGPYVEYTGTTPRSIQLYSHEAIWIEVGTYVPASQLPRVIFYTQY